MSGNGHVVIGWLPQPIAGTTVIQQGFFDSFFAFVSHDTNTRKIFGGYSMVGTGYIASGRDTLCQKFLESSDAEWLLMVDWDITFSPESVYALVDAADPLERPIIAGCYVTFFGDDAVLRPCWMTEQLGQEFVPANSLDVGKVIECSSVGMGFTLIHRSVLEALEKIHADDPWHWFGHDIINESRVGEDITFCNRARKAGFSCWGHGGVLLGHTKSKTFVVSDMADPKMAHQHAAINVDKRVLNVGGNSKGVPLPDRYAGWDHVLLDIDPRPGVDLVMDARNLRETPDLADGFDAVYCSHNLEHYHAHDIPTVLSGFSKVLRPGGSVDIRVPDMSAVFAKLAGGAELDDEAYVSPAGPILYRDMIYGYGKEIEQSGNDFFAHKTGFTKERLAKVLTDAGFENVSVDECDGFELHATASAPEVPPDTD